LSQSVPDERQSVLPNPEDHTFGELLSTGSEWIVDAVGCAPWKLARPSELQSLCDAIIADVKLHVVGSPQWHKFPGPGGVTGLYLLSESHLSCHSFPEHQLLTVNLYCCRDHARWNWEPELMQRLGATEVRVRKIDRGVPRSTKSLSTGDIA
jgi:S-adenosylmethionine decarboxylase